MTEYLISSKPQSTGFHVIHRRGCPMSDEPGNDYLLGVFECTEDALREGRMHYFRVRACPFCLRKHREEPVIPADYEPVVHSGTLRPAWDSVLLCGVS